jgi:hypothetical protein
MTEPACMLKPRSDEKLKLEGWTYRFTASGARLKEMVEAYEEAGFEVHVEPIKAEELEGPCRQCVEAEPSIIYAVYTRPKRESKLGELEDL